MDAADLDLEDLPPKALRKLIKSLLMKRGKPNDDKEAAESDKEREALADLHANHKGKGPSPDVEEDDLPPELVTDDDEDEESEDDDAEESGISKITKAAKKGKK